MALKMKPPAAKPLGPATLITEVIGPKLAELLSCAEAALDPPVGRVYLAPGSQVAWDDCCNGQLWVRLISLESLIPAKLGATSVDPCGLVWTATVGIGVLRCSASMDERGQLASAATFTSEAVQMLADEAALCQAIYCCDVLPMNKFDVHRWDPLGPEGGCVGGEWTMTMQVNNYGCSDT
jgi:hypothetical protein